MQYNTVRKVKKIITVQTAMQSNTVHKGNKIMYCTDCHAVQYRTQGKQNHVR